MADVKHTGGCHCGAVKYEITAPKDIKVVYCNCSICKKSGFLHLNVLKEDFTLLSGEADLTDYRFNTGAAQHLFCKQCGVKSFYGPRSHPECWAINVNCLDEGTFSIIERDTFDGQNWEANVEELRKNF